METMLNVLLFERDQTEAELMEMQFRKGNIRAVVKRVQSLDLLLVEAAEAPPDLVVANQALPRFDVAELVVGLARIHPRIPLILYALNGNEETAVECMKAGAADFILKKHMARFGDSVRRILARIEAEEGKRTQAEEAGKQQSDTRSEQKNGKEEGSGNPLFRQIVERTPDLIAVLGLDGRREYNNPAYADVLEDPDILAGTDSFLDILPEDRDRIREVFGEIVKRGYGARTEYRLLDKEGETRYMQSNSGVILNEEGDPARVVVISRDVTEDIRARQRFEMLVASTAGLSGEGFFSVLAHRLADALGVRAVLVSRLAGGEPPRVRSIGFCADGILQEEFTYALGGGPCETVLSTRDTVVIPSGVPALYPRMGPLGGMQVESYIGVPLLSTDGTPLGHLLLADDRPMPDVDRKVFLARVMSRRAALELQRMFQAEEAAATPPASQPAPVSAEAPRGIPLSPLSVPPASAPSSDTRWDEILDREAVLRSGFAGLPSPLLLTDEAGTILMVNARLEELCGRSSEDLVGRRAWPLLLNGGPWQLMREGYGDVVVRPDKTRVSVTVFAVPCTKGDGKVSRTLGVLTPLSDSKGRKAD